MDSTPDRRSRCLLEPVTVALPEPPIPQGPAAADPIDVILAIPPGVEPEVFPWGAFYLADSLMASAAPARPRLWHLNVDEGLADLAQQHRQLLAAVFKSMRWEVSRHFFGNTRNVAGLLGVVAYFGESFYSAARRRGALISPFLSRAAARRRGHRLVALRRDFEAFLDGRIRTQLSGGKSSRRLWAVSVYDRTIFNALFLAQRIKTADPESPVILGGEAFDSRSATEVIRHVAAVDAVVVGRGEQPLRDLVSRYHRGEDPRQARLPQTVTRAPLLHEEASYMEERPPACSRRPSPPLRRVYLHGDDVLRIQVQRGCSWGKCTFCAYSERDQYEPVPLAQMLDQTAAAVEALRRETSRRRRLLRVFIDSDECQADTLAPLLDCLAELREAYEQVRVIMWYGVREFRLSFFETLAAARDHGLSVLVHASTESLNGKTLRRMRKGHSPLQAIEGFKATQDCGHTILTNYFSWFPGDSGEGLQGEVDLLRRAAHLFAPPTGFLVPGPYVANTRDAVSCQPASFGVVIDPDDTMPWIEEAFGASIPFSVYGTALGFRRPRSGGRLVEDCYRNLLNWQPEELPYYGASPSSGALDELLFLPHWRAKRFLWWFSLLALRTLGLGSARTQRHRLLQHFAGLWRQAGSSRDGLTSSSPARPLLRRITRRRSDGAADPSSFVLAENDNGPALHKRCTIPGHRETWSIPLTATELSLLRFLYWYRPRREVVGQFGSQLGDRGLDSLLHRHLDLGSIVQDGQFLLSVVHDPGFWTSRDRPERTAPKRLTARSRAVGATGHD